MVTRRFFGTGLEARLTIVSSFFRFFFPHNLASAEHKSTFL